MEKKEEGRVLIKKPKTKIKKSDNLNIQKPNNLSIFKDIFPIMPLIVLVFFLPFIIRLKLIPLEGVFYDYWTGQEASTDFFTYYKQIFIYLITVWFLIHTFFFVKKVKRTKAYYFLGAYALLVVLSTVFSDFPNISLYGFVERKEGMWIVLCYIALTFSAINLVNTKRQREALIYSFAASGALISLIGIFQYIGMDIFASERIKAIIIPSEILSRVEEFNITLGEKYAYSVFYNPNYLGGYLSLYAPLMIGMAVHKKGALEKIVFSILFALSLIALFASRSEAGVIGFIVGSSLLILTFIIKRTYNNKNDKIQKKIIIPSVIYIVVALIVLPILLSFVPIEQNPLERIKKEALQMLNSDKSEIDYKAVGPINDIKRINNSEIEIVFGNIPVKLEGSDTEIRILNDSNSVVFSGKTAQITKNEYIHLTELSRFYEAYIMVEKTSEDDIYGIQLYFPKSILTLYFLYERDALYIADSSYRKLDIDKDLELSPYIGFEGKGNIGTGRGYIWSRSLPIVFENLIIGTGQDTFIVQFPQYDIFSKQVETGRYSIWMLTDKPHSLYLQIAIHSGLLSMLILLAGFALLMYRSFRLSMHEDNMAFIINAALIGFMVSSLFNDSILAITPIVYVLLGLNIAYILNQNNEKAVK